MKYLTEQDVKDVLYNVSPAGLVTLRSALNQRWGSFDEQTLVQVLGRLADRDEVSLLTVNGVQMWCLKGTFSG